MSGREYLMEWTSPIGGNWEYWIANREMIGEFIQANKLVRSEIGAVSPGLAPVAKVAPAVARAHIDLGIRGGIRVAHLHFDDGIYILNRDQWTRFSEQILADSKAKLANVKEIPFEAGILLGSAIETLGRG